jgi:LysM repeat protein
MLVVALLVPLALALRADESPADVVRDSPVGAVVAPAPQAAPSVDPPVATTAPAAVTAPPTTVAATIASDPTSSPAPLALVAPAEVEEEAERVEPQCPATYEAAEGDYWIRLADEAGVPMRDLLGVNAATTDTPLYPGTDVCLPPGAAMPSPPPPPTTAAPTTTAAPATTAAPTTRAAPTTTAPRRTTSSSAATATAAPPTTAAPRPAPASTDQVQALIREIWPDELEEKALQIAFRESRYQATAYNGWCCYGVFQIHWNAHKGWLAGVGVTSSQQLLDARTNIQIAYTIYQRAGGWGPWGG